jgi:hypothetical protein
MAANESYWIFVVPADSIESTLNRAVIISEWPIGKRTRYKKLLKKGDKVVVYVSGIKDPVFVASFEIDSYLQKGEVIGSDFVKISSILTWWREVEVRPLINRLGFIKNKVRWGGQFQSGIVRITKSDYQVIIDKAKSQNVL